MCVACKCGNLFFPCFYGWLVTVLCRFGKFIFSYLYVWQVLLSDVMKDVQTSYLVWEFVFPICSKRIYFSLSDVIKEQEPKKLTVKERKNKK